MPVLHVGAGEPARLAIQRLDEDGVDRAAVGALPCRLETKNTDRPSGCQPNSASSTPPVLNLTGTRSPPASTR